MPAYKDTESGKWYSSFYYTDWTGERKRKLKRGFDTKKEALAYEAEYIRKASADMDMKMSSFIDVYFNDKVGDLKERTIKNKRYMIDVHIIPYLGDKPMKLKDGDTIQVGITKFVLKTAAVAINAEDAIKLAAKLDYTTTVEFESSIAVLRKRC